MRSQKLTDDEIEEIKARNPIADVAGGYTKLRRVGGKLLGACPMCGGRANSGRFEVFEKDSSWGCYVCVAGGDVISLVEKAENVDFRTAIERLGGRREIDAAAAKKLFEAREKKRLDREKTAARYREAERKRLHLTWKRSVAVVHGTPVERYLNGRGLQLPSVCPGLRYLPSAPYWHGETIDSQGHKSPVMIHSGPAMLAAFIRSDGTFGGLHTTWLDGGAPPVKIELVDPASGEVLNSKKMRGSKTGAHIAVSALIEAPRRLVVGEGIETVLAVWTSFHSAGRALEDTAFWAAGDLGNMAGRSARTVPHPTLKRPNGRAISVPNDQPDPDDPGLSIPDSVDELVLLGDGDSEPVLTRFAMIRAARRYARPGRTIRIAFAPAGRDFNDVLREDRF
jgi:hypothetical protein